MLEIDNLEYAINGTSLIREISLKFKPGILYAILGPNGSGKSTLLKSLSNIWIPTRGRVVWQGEDLLQLSRPLMSKTISLVPQNPQLFLDFDVYSMVAMGRYPYGCRSIDSQKKVEKSLRQVNAWHLEHKCLSQLSGGERQRVYIARSLATDAPIVLLDEPTSHLDLRHQLEIWQLLRLLTKEGKLLITVVHDLLAAKRFCDQFVILNQGKCEAAGSWEEVMTSERLRHVFNVSHHTIEGRFEL
ncbi:MAG: ABC transporter ATP-binding protein [Parachlamydiaceae bacterium]